ncbi:hypothetical protein BGZ63DRAFT_349585 [Mariannaea sp. PMI_226]|nr:hypothetical protein BGZ63DRAFT_349585 [Mariannaea sp. PMI_226]
MGAQQSSEQNTPGDTATSAAKTCYYELLGVERQATDDEIKKAYRRKALELHPDRNINNVEIATHRFAEVQTAYEVLSDPHERAWYDSHREAILSGQDANDPDVAPASFRNVRLTSPEEIMGLIRKFNSSVPFDDEPTGFYGIVRETFEQLALEEEVAADNHSIDISEYPTFGCSDDKYEGVVKSFYAAWAGFSTAKSFAWKDKYRLSDAPDRRVRRLMEKENKKIRDDSIREFNDAVRFLVGFVRKRDPRYIPNSQTDVERQSTLRNAAAAQAARSRAANQERLASFEVPGWAQSRFDDAQTEDHFSPSSEEDSEVEILECVVCDKTFKSEKQLEAHERSKKHIKAVQQLRRQMQREGTDLQLDEVEPIPSPRPNSTTTSDIEEKDENENPAVNTEDQVPTVQSNRSEPNLIGSNEVSDNDEYAPRNIVEDRFASGNSRPTTRTNGEVLPEDLVSATQELSVDEQQIPGKKIGKAKAKRQRKAAAAAAQAQQDENYQCSSCGELYSSRTKLFAHLRDEGHAAPITNSSAGRRNKKK